MDKIETPEGIFDRIWEETMGNDYATYRKKMIAELTSCDALLRADERQKAAGLAVEYQKETCRENDFTCPSECLECERIRAAILAEPEEAQG